MKLKVVYATQLSLLAFLPLFVFAAPPQKDRFEILQEMRDAAKKNPPRHTPARIQVEIDAVNKALDEERALLRELEETARKKITEDIEANTKRLNRDLLEKELAYKKRLKLLDLRDKTVPKIHPLNIKQAEWNIFRYEATLAKLKKLKGGVMIIPVIIGAMLGLDGSPEAVAGSITGYIFDFDALIKQLEERRAVLERVRVGIIIDEKKYNEKASAIEDIRLYLEALNIRTEEEFNKNNDAVAALQRMSRLEIERNALLASIRLKPLIDNELRKIEDEIKDIKAKKASLPKIK